MVYLGGHHFSTTSRDSPKLPCLSQGKNLFDRGSCEWQCFHGEPVLHFVFFSLSLRERLYVARCDWTVWGLTRWQLVA